jgi:hypothetical protein
VRSYVRPLYDDQRTKLGALAMISRRGPRRIAYYKRPWLQLGRQMLQTDDEAELQLDNQLTSQTRRMLQQTDDQPMLTTRRPMLRTNAYQIAKAVLDVEVLERPRHSKILNDGFTFFDFGY